MGGLFGGWTSRANDRRALHARRVASSFLLVLAASVAVAQSPEPAWLEGTWVGTWWMGKYEEPIELVLSQRGAVLSGQVAMLGYPGTGEREGPFRIETASLEGDRLTLGWLMEGRRFTATLSLAGPGMLVGLGGEDGQVAAGFGLSRIRP
jgi:hypothetical protein